MTQRRVLSAILAVVALGILPQSAAAQTFDVSMAGWFATLQGGVSSVRVNTQQHSLSAQQVATSATSATQALANVIVEQGQQLSVRRAVARFESMHNDPVTGLCAPADTQRTARNAVGATTTVQAELADFERRWLDRGGDRVDTLVATQRLRREAFCSESERAVGLCSGPPSFGLPRAGDSDAAPWLVRRSYGSAEVDVGSVFMDTVAPFPTIEAAANVAGGSVEEIMAHAQARRELALVALARAGLADVLLRGLEGGTP